MVYEQRRRWWTAVVDEFGVGRTEERVEAVAEAQSEPELGSVAAVER